MYNKIFTKILDSSIWLESDPTRIVWLTFIAAMDEDGMVQFASAANVAHRARVSEEDARKAIAKLEGPDLNSSDPDNEGRRIERVPGGWLVLNAGKYRDLVTRTVQRERTRARVNRFRAKDKPIGNAPVTVSNVLVTQSEAYAEAEACAERARANSRTLPDQLNTPTFRKALDRWVIHWGQSFGNGRAIPFATEDAHLRKMVAMGHDGAIAAIDNAITRGLREPAAPFEQKKRANGHVHEPALKEV
jgi:hypothetical protein